MRMTPKLKSNMDALANAMGFSGEPSITRGRAKELLELIEHVVDDCPARLNRGMTRRQAWGIFADCARHGNPEDVLRGLIFKNIVAEFGADIQAALDAARRGA